MKYWQIALMLLFASLTIGWQNGVMAGIKLMAISAVIWFTVGCLTACIMNYGVDDYD